MHGSRLKFEIRALQEEDFFLFCQEILKLLRKTMTGSDRDVAHLWRTLNSLVQMLVHMHSRDAVRSEPAGLERAAQAGRVHRRRRDHVGVVVVLPAGLAAVGASSKRLAAPSRRGREGERESRSALESFLETCSILEVTPYV